MILPKDSNLEQIFVWHPTNLWTLLWIWILLIRISLKRQDTFHEAVPFESFIGLIDWKLLLQRFKNTSCWKVNCSKHYPLSKYFYQISGNTKWDIKEPLTVKFLRVSVQFRLVELIVIPCFSNRSLNKDGRMKFRIYL